LSNQEDAPIKATSPSSTPSVAKPNQPAGEQKKEQKYTFRSVASFGLALLAIGVILTAILGFFKVPSLVKSPITAAAGVNQFAIFYLMAQVIELLIEPFSESKVSPKSKTDEEGKKANPGPDKRGGLALFGDTDIIKESTDIINQLMSKIKSAQPLTSTEQDSLKKNETNLNIEQTTRVISMWGLASLMGMILSYFTVGLFEFVGTPFVVWGGHTLDAILSGIVIGAGTKPLHDLIGYLQKSSTTTPSK
jgi:hypothetical protein